MTAKMTLTNASPADTNASSTDTKKADSNTKEDGLDRIVEQWQQQGVTEDLIPMAVLGRIARLTKYIEVVLLQCHAEFGLGQGVRCARDVKALGRAVHTLAFAPLSEHDAKFWRYDQSFRQTRK